MMSGTVAGEEVASSAFSLRFLPPPGWLRAYSLFLMSFSSLRMREDSCSGVGALKEREGPPSLPEGGVGNLCLKSSSMLLCSLRLRPWRYVVPTPPKKSPKKVKTQNKPTFAQSQINRSTKGSSRPMKPVGPSCPGSSGRFRGCRRPGA